MLHGSTIDIMMTLAFKEAFNELLPRFERDTGCKVTGGTVATGVMVRRLKEGDVTDVVICSAAAVEELIGAGVLDGCGGGDESEGLGAGMRRAHQTVTIVT